MYYVITVETTQQLSQQGGSPTMYGTVVGPFSSTAEFNSQYPSAGLIPGEPAGGYATQGEAQSAADKYNALPASQRVGVSGALAPGVAPGINSPLPKGPSWPSFSGIFSGFFQANIWIRAGEVVLGLVLIAVGIARLTNSVPLATKVAKSVGTVALA